MNRITEQLVIHLPKHVMTFRMIQRSLCPITVSNCSQMWTVDVDWTDLDTGRGHIWYQSMSSAVCVALASSIFMVNV